MLRDNDAGDSDAGKLGNVVWFQRLSEERCWVLQKVIVGA